MAVMVCGGIRNMALPHEFYENGTMTVSIGWLLARVSSVCPIHWSMLRVGNPPEWNLMFVSRLTSQQTRS
jgi:hypothetical protein